MFLQKMNELADTLGMVNSLFTNPTGLSQKTNFSSAEDICKATAEGMKSELFRTIVSTKRYSCVTRGEDSIRLSWQNTNKLLEEGWEGVKTGVTPSAGACLACCARVMSGGVPLQVGIVLLQC
jgi:serine-type D-Ala-D-Ala carboxypeptidase (penicillin-binding protein 5/6)